MDTVPSYRFKLLFCLAVILIAAVLSAAFINYYVSKESIKKDLLTSDLPLTRDTIYSEIQRDLMPPTFVSSSMANDTFLKDWALAGENLDAIVKYLDGIHKKYDFFSTFFVSNRSGLYYHYTGILKKISEKDAHDVWYYDFIQSDDEYDLDVDTNQASNDILTIFINFRVEDYDGSLLGVTGVGLQMDHVAKLFRLYQDKYARTIYLVDPLGLIQVHSGDPDLIGKPMTALPGLQDITADILSHQDAPADFEYKKNGRNHLLTVRYLPEINWYLLVEQSEDQALTTVKANLWRTLLIGLVTSTIVMVLMLIMMNYYQKQLQRLAVTDPLTGTANRRLLEEHYLKAVARYERSNRSFSILVIDLDNFKAVNDSFGHVEGDKTLRQVAEILSRAIRKQDLLARWGGDEFAVLVEGGLEQAVAMGERMRLLVEKSRIPSDRLRVTVSAGAAEYRKEDSLDILISRADKALFKAKEEGRNRVVAS